MCLTQRQVGNKKSEIIKLSREMPQQLAIGLAVHQSGRSRVGKHASWLWYICRVQQTFACGVTNRS